MNAALMPGLDTGHIARIYAALAGSPWADAAEREAVAQDAHPGTRAARDRILRARQYHAAAAVRACTHGIRGIVFGACGLPAEPEPHTAAAVACPDARFVFCDPDPIVAKICGALPGEAGRIAVCTESLRDPGELLSCPEVAGLPKPLHLQAQMSLHFWPPKEARDLVRDYARLLAARSELLLTWTLPSDTDGGRELMAVASEISGTEVYRHPAGEVAGWLDDCGLRVMPPGRPMCAAGCRCGRSASGQRRQAGSWPSRAGCARRWRSAAAAGGFPPPAAARSRRCRPACPRGSRPGGRRGPSPSTS